MQASDVALVEEKLDLGSRIKVVSLLKRILEKKKDRRRQLRFSVVYPIKSYLISNATNVTMFENLKKCLIQHCERNGPFWRGFDNLKLDVI